MQKSEQEAADLASCGTFGEEPSTRGGIRRLEGIAECSSVILVKVAYPNHDFPHTSDGAVCVLCQQQFGADAVDRIERFQQFVVDTTARGARCGRRRVAEF